MGPQRAGQKYWGDHGSRASFPGGGTFQEAELPPEGPPETGPAWSRTAAGGGCHILNEDWTQQLVPQWPKGGDDLRKTRRRGAYLTIHTFCRTGLDMSCSYSARAGGGDSSSSFTDVSI